MDRFPLKDSHRPRLAAAAWSCALVLILSARPSASTPPFDALPRPNIDLARAAISDLKVFVDYDEDTATFASWPVDKFGRRLAAGEIARAIRLGLLLWASVLPDMRFRLVQRESEANLIVRFGPYRMSGFTDAGGRAFTPDEWALPDGDCGRKAENRRPNGARCAEWEHCIILLENGRWAVKGIDWRGMRMAWLDFAWIFDPALPHFGAAGKCRDGRDTSAPWTEACVPFRQSPYFDSLAGADLASAFAHELGHTLLGAHTPAPYACADLHRRPILSRDSCVRLTSDGYSILFPGDGLDCWWNRRGVFGADAARLKALGYRVSYPMARAVLILTGPGGRSLRTRDWRAAQAAMIWPLRSRVLSAAEARRELFLTEIRLDE
ncbi:MAG: hypothetical protein JF616_03525 [Fibrobacteres bacterium]|nr:hypothetical protein [Fibrobacterota bacterium]